MPLTRGTSYPVKQLGQARLSSEERGGGECGQQAPLQSLTRGGGTMNAAKGGSREQTSARSYYMYCSHASWCGCWLAMIELNLLYTSGLTNQRLQQRSL